MEPQKPLEVIDEVAGRLNMGENFMFFLLII